MSSSTSMGQCLSSPTILLIDEDDDPSFSTEGGAPQSRQARQETSTTSSTTTPFLPVRPSHNPLNSGGGRSSHSPPMDDDNHNHPNPFLVPERGRNLRGLMADVVDAGGGFHMMLPAVHLASPQLPSHLKPSSTSPSQNLLKVAHAVQLGATSLTTITSFQRRNTSPAAVGSPEGSPPPPHPIANAISFSPRWSTGSALSIRTSGKRSSDSSADQPSFVGYHPQQQHSQFKWMAVETVTTTTTTPRPLPQFQLSGTASARLPPALLTPPPPPPPPPPPRLSSVSGMDNIPDAAVGSDVADDERDEEIPDAEEEDEEEVGHLGDSMMPMLGSKRHNSAMTIALTAESRRLSGYMGGRKASRASLGRQPSRRTTTTSEWGNATIDTVLQPSAYDYPLTLVQFDGN